MSKAVAVERAAQVTLEKIQYYLDEMTRSLSMYKYARSDDDYTLAGNTCMDALQVLHTYGFHGKDIVFDEAKHGWVIRAGIDPVEHARAYILLPYTIDPYPKDVPQLQP